MGRYGRIILFRDGDMLLITSSDSALIAEIMHHRRTQPFLLRQLDAHTLQINAARRGHIKQALIHIGFPAEDLAGYTDGSPLPMKLRPFTAEGKPFEPRAYQYGASAAFYAGCVP